MLTLSEVADERPLLGVIDDAQWLDRTSAQTLAFVARRLLAEPMGLVFAARECPEELRGVPEFEVPGLGEEDARALLMSEVRFPLDARVCDQIVAETRGNPLALLELPRGMSAAELAVAGFGFLGAHTLSGRMDSFARRLEELPEETRLLLLDRGGGSRRRPDPPVACSRKAGHRAGGGWSGGGGGVADD